MDEKSKQQANGISNDGYVSTEFFLHGQAQLTHDNSVEREASTIIKNVYDIEWKTGENSKNNTPSERRSYGSRDSVISTDNDDNREPHSSSRVVNVKSKASSVDIGTELIVQRKRRFQVPYEYAVWAIFLSTTALCIADRFVDKGDIVLERKGKRLNRLWGSTFAETATNVIWGVTARLIITSQNLMFYTTLWCFPNIIAEIAPRFVAVNGIRDLHIKIHRIAGIFLIGIPSLAHVLVIFLPPLMNKSSLTYSPPCNFNYSKQLGNLNWTKFWDPAAVENWSFNDAKGVHLTADEMYRFLLMIVLFCLLFPLSRSRYLNDRSYSFAMVIHVFAGVWYAIDNIRKITHGLAHIFNLPFLILWCLDRLVSITSYHTSHGEIISKRIIGENNYVVLKLKLNKSPKAGVGDVYYLKSNYRGLSSLFERSHPFTSFSNHSHSDRSWDIGFLVTIMPDDNQWYPSWTRRLLAIENTGNISVQTWGPYRSSPYQLYRKLMYNNDGGEFCLLASGSGFGYLLDILGILAYKTPKQTCFTKINIHYTVRQSSVVNHFIQQIKCLLNEIDNRNATDINFNFYITETQKNGLLDCVEGDKIHINTGRMKVDQIISAVPKNSCVYFVGRPSLADQIDKICEQYNVTLHIDYTNSQRGKSDKKLMLTYLKYTITVLTLSALISILLSIYLHSF